MAAALSVQSPFSRVPLGKNDITVRLTPFPPAGRTRANTVFVCLFVAQVTRRPLESEHGDPFTLLNAFEEWVEVSKFSRFSFLRQTVFSIGDHAVGHPKRMLASAADTAHAPSSRAGRRRSAQIAPPCLSLLS